MELLVEVVGHVENIGWQLVQVQIVTSVLVADLNFEVGLLPSIPHLQQLTRVPVPKLPSFDQRFACLLQSLAARDENVRLRIEEWVLCLCRARQVQLCNLLVIVLEQ